MKKQILYLTLIMLICSFCIAGSLEPPAAPAPTMKTLDEVEPRIPIPASDSPAGLFMIYKSGSYYLTGDRFCTTGIGVDANDVTIDLSGYSLIGQGGGFNYGIYITSGRSNVEIRNGTVRNFDMYAIWETSNLGKGHRIINIRAVSNGKAAGFSYPSIYLPGIGHLVKDCTAAENDSYGIYTGPGSTISSCTAYDNNGIGINTGSGSTISGCTAYNNNSAGINASSGCTISSCTAYSNTTVGINAGTGNTISGCTALLNASSGISTASGCTVTNCTVTYNTVDGIKTVGECRVVDNTCNGNGNGGDGAGIHTTSTGNRIEGNNVTDNDRGIDVDAAGSIIIKNTAAGNALNYTIAAGNAYGQIINVAGPAGAGFVNSDPTANFQF